MTSREHDKIMTMKHNRVNFIYGIPPISIRE